MATPRRLTAYGNLRVIHPSEEVPPLPILTACGEHQKVATPSVGYSAGTPFPFGICPVATDPLCYTGVEGGGVEGGGGEGAGGGGEGGGGEGGQPRFEGPRSMAPTCASLLGTEKCPPISVVTLHTSDEL